MRNVSTPSNSNVSRFSFLPDAVFKKIVAKAFSETHDPASLALVNKEFRSIIPECREDYLEKVPLIKFMKQFCIDDFHHIKKDVRERLMANPKNRLIPQSYIDKDLKAILLNKGTAYKIFSTANAFCAVLDDGSVHTWGRQADGGQKPVLPVGVKVKSVFSTDYAFCAILDDGRVHTWGDEGHGGQQPAIAAERTFAYWEESFDLKDR